MSRSRLTRADLQRLLEAIDAATPAGDDVHPNDEALRAFSNTDPSGRSEVVDEHVIDCSICLERVAQLLGDDEGDRNGGDLRVESLVRFPPLLAELGRPLKLTEIARETGLFENLQGVMSRLEADLSRRFPRALGEAQTAVGKLVDIEAWEASISEYSEAADPIGVAAAAGGPLRLRLRPKDPSLPGELVVEEVQQGGSWSTRFDYMIDSDEDLREVRWRLVFDPQDEEQALTHDRGLRAEHLGLLRLYFGESAWGRLLDMLLPFRHGKLDASKILSCVIEGRMPGLPTAFELMVDVEGGSSGR